MLTVSPHVASLTTIVGRQAELQALRAAFLSGSKVQVLTGMGGVGKTSLARTYAQQHLDDYGLIWWIRAEDPAPIDAEFRSLLDVLLPPGDASKITDARAKAFDLLAHHDGPWLLVLDNVPDASASTGLRPPTGNGHILITSRAVDWPTASTIRPLAADAAVELLTTQSGDGDTEAAETLAAELGRLPLALTQAAAFTRTTQIGLATYLRLYHDRSAELLEEGRPPDYPHTVATTWQLAIDRLSDPAREMLNILAFYAPDAIPVNLLFASWDELDKLRAIRELHAYSLVNPAGPDTVSVHRLVQSVTRHRLQADLVAHEWADEARSLIMAAIPEESATAISISTWNALYTHVLALLGHLPPEHPNTLSTRYKLGYWIGTAGNAAAARDQFAELLPVRERVSGAEHPSTLNTRHHMAYWTGQAGKATTARDLFAELLPVCERVLGAEHRNTLTSRHNLAFWTARAGKASTARDLFAELLPIRERVLGAEHPDTLITWRELAHWTGNEDDPARARDLFAELLPIHERVLGAEHPDTLASRHNLAYWTACADDPARARDLFAELLPIRERVSGAEHPDTLTARHNLAWWTWRAGNVAKARELFAELLPIRERVLGVDHHDTVQTRKGLAGAVEEVGPGGGGEG